MTAPAYAKAFPHAPVAFSNADEVACELQLVGLLRVAGFPEFAHRRLEALVAKVPTSAAVAAAAGIVRERGLVDTWLAAEHGDAASTLVPSAMLKPDGLPRFVVALPRMAGGALTDSVRRELSGEGADSELRNFLDEILIEELGFIDFEPGAGFATLTAASAPVPATAVCAISTDPREAAALELAIEASGHIAPVNVIRNMHRDVTVDSVLRNQMADVGEVVVYAGVAGSVPAVIAGATASIGTGRVAALAWRCMQRAGDLPMSNEQFSDDVTDAMTELAGAGFVHFALAAREDDVELVPVEMVAGNALIVSLSPEYLARAGAA